MMDTSNTPTKPTPQVVHRVCISMYKLIPFYGNTWVMLVSHFFVTLAISWPPIVSYTS